MKKFLIIIIILLLGLYAQANTHNWKPGDHAFIAHGCKTADYLYTSSYLHLNPTRENIEKINKLWKISIESGECFDISPKKARVRLMELLELFPGLNKINDATGELWKAMVMSKGSTGDFEDSSMIIYIGIYEKKFSKSGAILSKFLLI
jgi:hypothetical protein